jgi:hypothetical protein
MSHLSSSLALLVLAVTTATGCVAESEESRGESEAPVIADPGGGGASANSPVCTIEGFAMDKWPTALPQSPDTTKFIEDRIKKSGKSYTVEDFGPYQRMRFTIRVRAASDVDASISLFHTLPGGVVLPEQTSWKGKLPKDYQQEIVTELYYDADKHGLGPTAPRFGKNVGKWVFSCTANGRSSKDEQSYAFTRAAG